MTNQEKREANWTLKQYIVYLRQANRTCNEAEIDMVSCLMRLEQKTALWKVWGIETFGQALNDNKWLGLSISPVRYENVKRAILDFGEATVRRWGLSAARYARRLNGDDRVQFVGRVEGMCSKYQRPLSAQAAFGAFREVAPSPPVSPTTDPAVLRIRRLEKEIERLRDRETYLLERIAVKDTLIETVRMWLIANNVRGFSWTKALREAQAAAKTKKRAA